MFNTFKYALLCCFCFGMLLIQCKPKETAEQPADKIEKVDTSGPEYTSKYICPMFCKGSGSDQPGVCPACGMDYVLNENLDEPDNQESNQEGGHEHEHGDTSHSH